MINVLYAAFFVHTVYGNIVERSGKGMVSLLLTAELMIVHCVKAIQRFYCIFFQSNLVPDVWSQYSYKALGAELFSRV